MDCQVRPSSSERVRCVLSRPSSSWGGLGLAARTTLHEVVTSQLRPPSRERQPGKKSALEFVAWPTIESEEVQRTGRREPLAACVQVLPPSVERCPRRSLFAP